MHFNRRSLILSSAAGLGLLALGSCGESSATDKVLRFTAIPDTNSTELEAKFAPLAEYFATELGVEVEYIPTTDYAASVEAFRNGDVQLAWFGGLTGAKARAAVEGSRAIAQGKVDPNFKTYFVAHKDAGIAASQDFPADLAGKTFTFGSELSTSGRLMPEYYIREKTGKSPEEFFGKENHYSGSHDSTADLVNAGTFQAGALNYKTYDKMVAEGKIDPEVCVKVWTTPEYADYNWTAHPALDESFGPGFVDKLQATLVSISEPELLAAVDRAEGLIKATNADFQSIHDLARQLDFLK